MEFVIDAYHQLWHVEKKLPDGWAPTDPPPEECSSRRNATGRQTEQHTDNPMRPIHPGCPWRLHQEH